MNIFKFLRVTELFVTTLNARGHTLNAGLLDTQTHVTFL